MENNQQPTTNSLSFSRLVDDLLLKIPERSREIIKKRFGLSKGEGETLEKIGSDYGITRERVRQIIADVIKNISVKNANQEFRGAEDKLVFTISANNGIIREDEIKEKLKVKDAKEINAIKFLAECSKKVFLIEERGIVAKSLALSPETLRESKEVALQAESILQKEKKTLSAEELVSKLASIFSDKTEKELAGFLSVMVRVQQNRFGKWGMYNWTQINPKGTREKIYLVLKEEKHPRHFTEIAKLIDKYALGRRKAHPQTVHNELIKDDRFVLIGRGIYALSEWGYTEGTIKEVLREILEKSQEPLSKEEIMERVSEVRQVKKATVMINLNNHQMFVRSDEGYSLKR